MGRILAISDIHGCGKTFSTLLKSVSFDKTDTLVIIGDLVDRGKNTKFLIDEIIRLRTLEYNIIVTKGNHEDLMINSVNSEANKRNWKINGGIETLNSFGISCYREIPIKYKNFFETLPLKAETDNYIFVHAGINNVHFTDPFKESVVLWTKDWYDLLDRNWLGFRYIIHGHVPKIKEDIIKHFSDFDVNRYLNIDAGCVYDCNYFLRNNSDNDTAFGKLCIADLTNRKLYFEDNCD